MKETVHRGAMLWPASDCFPLVTVFS